MLTHKYQVTPKPKWLVINLKETHYYLLTHMTTPTLWTITMIPNTNTKNKSDKKKTKKKCLMMWLIT